MMVAEEAWCHFVHNFDRYQRSSLVIEGADGYTVRERRYGTLVDGNAGYWCVPFGYDRELFQAVADRASYFAHGFGRSHPAAMELAYRICRATGYDRALFGTSGSEAVDAALRMTFQCVRSQRPQRTSWLALPLGYHGSTSLCLQVCGFEDRQAFLPQTVAVHRLGRWVFDPDLIPATAAAALAAEPIDWSTIVGFILEPIQGVAGARLVNPLAYQLIAEQCHREGALVVADEVTSGCGRFGQLLATSTWEPRPDIICLGKAFAAGFYPLSATLITEAVYQLIEASTTNEQMKWLYGGTFAGQPLGCALALETLDRLSGPLFMRVRTTGAWLAAELTALAMTTNLVTRLSGRDFMWALSLPDQHEAEYRWQRLLQAGYLFGLEGRKLLLVPALTIPQSLLLDAVQALSDVLRRD